MILFISDLHLSPQTPGVTRIFLEFLGGRARSAGHLYILGDLFEAWPGDDCIDDPDDTFNRRIVDALRALTDTGTGLSVMHGNRDFLLGEEFARRSGARLLADPSAVTLSGKQFVLTHGDRLCTDDTEYQAFRQTVRTPGWRDAFLARPLRERKAVAASLRRQSEDSKRVKPQDLMDLNPEATGNFLREHPRATLIHGHTHRPGRHEHLVDGVPVDRWVLSDWKEDRGDCLVWDGQALMRETLE